MSSSRQFLENLGHSGLMREAEIQEFLRGVDESSSGNAEFLARELVRQGRLTSFQANAVHQGRTKGLVFGEYVILDKIGVGGMGRVFKARHRRMDRYVALKVLPKEALGSAEAVERFHREVRTAARLSHPNIVTAFDAGEHQGIHYLVMEYVDGPDLSQILKEEGTLPVPQAVEVILQAARGLAYAHARGVIHRDIKPSNLLLSSDGTVKILDLGLARTEAGGAAAPRVASIPDTKADELTHVGQVMGTIDYMAPEQAEDIRRADARADIYSLGCTLFRLLTGRIPYPGKTLLKRLLAHREQPIPSLRKFRADVPESVDRVFQKMLAKQPEDRPPSMTALVDELDALLPTLEAQVALCEVRAKETGASDEVAEFLRELQSDADEMVAVADGFAAVDPSGIRLDPALKQEAAERTRRSRRGRRVLFLVAAAGVLLVPFIAALANWRLSARLEIDWPAAERADSILEIDGRRELVPDSGRMEFSLMPGPHRVVILRRGYEPVTLNVDLERGRILTCSPHFRKAGRVKPD